MADLCESYDALAPYYEQFTRDYPHDAWLDQLEALVREHGLEGRSVLDVACGTGRSVRPLAAMGYRVVACDGSPAMLREARRRSPGVDFQIADMRALPRLGTFDWLTCINDAINYLLEPLDLRSALSSMARQLRIGGMLVFDVNTLREHRAGFEATFVVEDESAFLCWEGKGCGAEPGYPGFADIAIFHRHRDTWRRATSRHVQRWWAAEEIATAAAFAGLSIVAVRGQLPGAVLEHTASEDIHSKLIYVLRRDGAELGCEKGGPR